MLVNAARPSLTGAAAAALILSSPHRAWRRDVERAQTDIRLDQTRRKKTVCSLESRRYMQDIERKRFAKTGPESKSGFGHTKNAPGLHGSFCGAVIRLKGFYVDQNLEISLGPKSSCEPDPACTLPCEGERHTSRAPTNSFSSLLTTKPPSAAKVSSLSAQAEPALLCGQDSERTREG